MRADRQDHRASRRTNEYLMRVVGFITGAQAVASEIAQEALNRPVLAIFWRERERI
jgi:hypothetical protein